MPWFSQYTWFEFNTKFLIYLKILIKTRHDQSIPQDIVETHELEAITIDYRHECQYSDTIDSLASTELEVESVNPFRDKSASSNFILNSKGLHQFLHLLKFSGTDQETNRGRTVWRKMDQWYTNGHNLGCTFIMIGWLLWWWWWLLLLLLLVVVHFCSDIWIDICTSN